MQLIIDAAGNVRCVYAEAINLSQLGNLTIARGSHVEPDHNGNWFADLQPVNGPRLGPFQQRSSALQAEADWLEKNWLTASN